MNKTHTIIIILLLCLAINLSAQNEEDPCYQKMDKTTEKEFQKARKLHKSGKKKEAFVIYRSLLDGDPNLLEVNYYYGLGNFLTVRLGGYDVITNKSETLKALEAFTRIFEVCPEYKPETNLYAMRLAYILEKYDLVIKFANFLIKNPDLLPAMDDYEEVEMALKKAKFYKNIFENPVPFDPKPVQHISTAYDEFLATISPDGEQFYFTRRMPDLNSQGFGSELSEREYFSMSTLNKDGTFSKGEALPIPFNTSYKEGSPTINLTNDLLIFTRMTRVTLPSSSCGGSNNCSYANYDLFYSEYIDGEWTEAINLGSKVNRTNSWESNPSLSSDGKLLFFASDRQGGYGGSDIWVTEKKPDGSWSEARNLGPTINTAGNERSPFLHTDSKTLYFSSDGHYGLGGQDIYYSKLDETGKWEKPVNIGYPINSENDEIDFFVSLDGKTAYYSSNNMGNGDWNIYQFELYEEARPRNVILLKGEVQTDQDDLADITVEIRDSTSQVIASTTVNENTGKYALVAEIDKYNPQPLIVNVKKENFVYDTRLIFPDVEKTVVKSDAELKKVEKGKTYNLHDINFATNKYSLTKESEFIIDLFIEFLKESPTIKVEIQGHTDNIGDPKTNQVLSENRAKSVYDYLLSKHVNSNRITYRGYGANSPVAVNTTEEGRAKNRRTVFVITDM